MKYTVWAIVVVVLLLAISMIGLVFPIQFVWYIVAGWAHFLVRNASRMNLDPATIALAFACLVAFTLGLHVFLCSITRAGSSQFGDGDGPHETSPRRWRKRWTFSLVALSLFAFIAGTSFYGVTRQLAAMAVAPTPVIESSMNSYFHGRSAIDLRQIHMATQSYVEEHQSLPSGATVSYDGRMLHSWMTLILPQMEQHTLYEKIDLTAPWDDPTNADAMKTRISTYMTPGFSDEHDDLARPLAGYSANAHVISGSRGRKIDEITDGHSQTILFGEVAANRKAWGHPANWRDPAIGIGAPDGFDAPEDRGPTRGPQFVFADGSVREIPKSIDPKILRALATPAGGENVQLPSLDPAE